MVGNLKIVGLWEEGRNVFLDYVIVNPNATSNASQDWKTIFNQNAKKKHYKYDCAVEGIRGCFTPMMCTTACVLHDEFKQVLYWMDYALSLRLGKNYSVTKNVFIVQVEFAIIVMSLRGTWHKLNPYHFKIKNFNHYKPQYWVHNIESTKGWRIS